MHMGQRIRELREQKGLNQPELARRIKIAQPSLSAIESGKTKTLRDSTLLRLAAALDTDPEYIRTGRHAVRQSDLTPEEGRAVDLLRQMDDSVRDTWIATGEVMLERQRARDLHKESLPAPTGDVVKEIISQLRNILDTHGADTLSRTLAALEGAASATPGAGKEREAKVVKGLRR
jgi:transcriptional regulator with XRE-family HTH domain